MIRVRKDAFLYVGLAFVQALVAATTVRAQERDWPNRNIQIVVPYTPGTGADILARIKAD